MPVIQEISGGQVRSSFGRLPLVDVETAVSLSGLALGGEASTELFFSHQVFACIADATGRQDVGDPIRATAIQRQAMVLFERTDRAAVGTSVFALDDEVMPLSRREEAFGAFPESPMLLALRPDDVWMGTVIRGDLGLQPILVASVTGAPFRPMLFPMLFRMRLTPALHARARLLGVALHPLAPYARRFSGSEYGIEHPAHHALN
jgi:hypothetical protein